MVRSNLMLAENETGGRMTTDTKELLTYAAKSGDKNAALRMATLRLAAEIWRAKEGAQRD